MCIILFSIDIMAKRKLLEKINNRKAAKKRWDKHEDRRASAVNAINARWAKKERDNGDDVPMPPPDASDDPSTAAPVPEIVEEPPATPGPEFPPPEVTPPPATPGDVLPPVIAMKRQICAPLHYQTVETLAGVGFFCADIERALKFRLQSAKDNLKYIDPNVLLKLSGDFGQGFTKITISFGEAQRPNSPANNFVAAVLPAKDSRANMEVYGGTLWDQIDQLKLLDGRRVKWFLGGDVSFVWGMVGHCGSARTTFPSPVCTCPRDQLLDDDKCRLRSVAETVQQAQQFAQAIQRGESATKALRAITMGIVKTPLLPAIDFDRIILAPFHVFQGLGNALVRELERQTACEATVQQFLRRIGARREQFRKKDYTGNTVRKILLRAAEMVPLFKTEWPKTICVALSYLGKIQEFSKAQPLLPREVGELEDHMDNFKAFLVDQPQMQLLLSQKPKAHLLLVHFVPFARQHHFLGLMDEQGDEALHSVWRRLEQLWKTMPDVAQIRQQLEHQFVHNWLLDSGKLEEMELRRMETQSTGELEEDRMDDEEDDDCFADVG